MGGRWRPSDHQIDSDAAVAGECHPRQQLGNLDPHFLLPAQHERLLAVAERHCVISPERRPNQCATPHTKPSKCMGSAWVNAQAVMFRTVGPCGRRSCIWQLGGTHRHSRSRWKLASTRTENRPPAPAQACSGQNPPNSGGGTDELADRAPTEERERAQGRRPAAGEGRTVREDGAVRNGGRSSCRLAVRPGRRVYDDRLRPCRQPSFPLSQKVW